VENWVKGGGVGFADIVYKHIIDRFSHSARPVRKPMGPIPLEKGASFKIESTGKKSDRLPIKIKTSKENGDQAATPILSPWEGELISAQRMPSHLSMLKIKHDNNLVSTIVFDGLTKMRQKSEPIPAGSLIGRLDPDRDTLMWIIEDMASENFV